MLKQDFREHLLYLSYSMQSLPKEKRPMRDQVKRLLFFAVVLLILGSLPVWADSAKTPTPVQFAPETRVMLFSVVGGQWIIAEFGRVRAGCEFYFNNQLYSVIDSEKAQVVLSVDTGKLFEADRPANQASRKPKAGDVVQVVGKDSRISGHALLATVQPGATVRFQGKAYTIKADRTLADAGKAPQTNAVFQHIEITRSSAQHVIDRHTVNGTQTAGKSVFSPSEDIAALIKQAELVTPLLEPNGYSSREFDAGRIIGTEGYRRKETSAFRVITTKTGKLVTAYPVLWR